MQIEQFTWSIVDSNSFLITEGNFGVLIDVVDEDELFDRIMSLDEIFVILTHSHFDHIIGLNHIRKKRPDVITIATQNCSNNIGNKYRNMSSTATAFMSFYNGSQTEIEPFICTPVNIVFDTKFDFNWFGHAVNLIAVYGHSNDGLIAKLDDKYLFTGDTLLHTPTVTRFPGGSSERFWGEDMPLMKRIEGIEAVYPGHGECGKLKEMLFMNQYYEKLVE